MIKLADNSTFPEVKDMWKKCFDDPQNFVELYFREKYRNENTLIYFQEGKAIASLQMLPYTFTFYRNEIPVAYISGACTLPEYRSKGYMGELLKASFSLMEERNIPLSILIPAEDWLYAYYQKYGYEKVFKEDTTIIPLKEILSEGNGDLDIAYTSFDKLFRNKDFTIQKTKEDFITIIQDAEMDNFPEKTNLSGMARIIDAKKLLDSFAKKYPKKNFILQVQDSIIHSNNALYKIKKGQCLKLDNKDKYDFKVNINLLTQLLFGFNLHSLSPLYLHNFEIHSPILNLMLE